MKKLTTSFCLFAVCQTLWGASFFAVSPGFDEVGPGNASESAPFNTMGVTVRYQEVFGAVDFINFAPSGGYLSFLRFRADERLGRPFTPTVINNIQISLSTTARRPDGLSATFADNVGGDNTVVVNGSLTLSSPTGHDFDIRIPFSQPFFFDPNAGNLLMDIRLFSGGATTVFDAQESFGDSISSIFAVDVNSPIATTITTRGLVAGFLVTPVPEPGTLALLGLGACLCGAAAWRQRRVPQPPPLRPLAPA